MDKKADKQIASAKSIEGDNFIRRDLRFQCPCKKTKKTLKYPQTYRFVSLSGREFVHLAWKPSPSAPPNNLKIEYIFYVFFCFTFIYLFFLHAFFFSDVCFECFNQPSHQTKRKLPNFAYMNNELCLSNALSIATVKRCLREVVATTATAATATATTTTTTSAATVLPSLYRKFAVRLIQILRMSRKQ